MIYCVRGRVARIPTLLQNPSHYGEIGHPPRDEEVSEQKSLMATPTEFFHWYIVDERTGKRERTTYKLTRKDAEHAFPGAEPDPSSREVRNLNDPGEVPPNSRPGEKWAG